ncbi:MULTISPECIES: Ku protein [unclassified Paenibacillus]|uniref:non-homologous end joining protein Ku n=1 Tax=unclassified Paenibacillus TaxID=185978 RepID=UPI0015C65D02|nr:MULTISPECIES: Ku protein [unclassified Paenibacillus]MBY3621313.1 Ku protein [Acinetobacter sp. CUI P1]MDH6373092.1 DNA end-binding protein Ku [Paenibacillus sp. PastF-3]
MHTIWKGAISFGLVHIPVKLYAATEEKEIALHLLHKSCHGTIKNQRYCPTCQSSVEPEDLIKGYPLDTNQYVTFEKNELDQIQEDASKQIRIIDFVKEEQVDLMFTQKVYFLGPDNHGSNAYYLLLKALEASKRLAIAKFTLRSSTKLCILKPIDGTCIQLATMYYANEIRPSENVPNIPNNISVDPNQLKLALQIVKGMSGTSDLASYTNPEQERLLAAIQSKIAGQNIVLKPVQETNVVVDLLEALQESVKMNKGKKKVASTKESGRGTPKEKLG